MTFSKRMQQERDETKAIMLLKAEARIQKAFLDWQKEEPLERHFVFICYWKDGHMKACRGFEPNPEIEIEVIENITDVSMQKKFEQRLGEKLQQIGFSTFKFRPSFSFKRYFAIAIVLS